MTVLPKNYMTPLKLSLRIASVPLTLTKEDGTEEEFELREMLADARDRHMDGLSLRVNIGPDGKPQGIKKFEGLQADLVCSCCYRKKDGKPVTRAEVQKWPASVMSAVYKAAQELNHLSEEEKAAHEKKDLPASD